MGKLSRNQQKEVTDALELRRQLTADYSRGVLNKRDLLKIGLLTGGAITLPREGSLAAALTPPALFAVEVSPPTVPFVEPLPIPPVKQPVASLSPAPTQAPNTGAGEGRTKPHQAWTSAPPQKYYDVRQKLALVDVGPGLPIQNMWGFDGIFPGPTYIARYGEPMLVRNFNELPVPGQNGGFGIPSVSTHLHNGHTPSESDGYPCDFFSPYFSGTGNGAFYDHHYPNVLAGGDPLESMGTLWYHDHRVDFTAQNVYKGLAGFFLMFNTQDTGDETTGFRLPAPYAVHDIPMMFNDKVFDANTGQLFFDLANLDGILGDKFLVNGKVQPFFTVSPRRYRFRWLNGGPSRFYQLFFTDANNLNASVPFWQIAGDGNLLPNPLQMTSVSLGVAERADVVMDFTGMAGKTFYIENRLIQTNGRGPTRRLTAAGQGNLLLKIQVTGPAVTDNSLPLSASTTFYSLPPASRSEARITRTFKFDRAGGQWVVNRKVMQCGVTRLRVKRNTAEIWVLQNSGNWAHPVHIHFEEFQMLTRNGATPPVGERGRKDVVRLLTGDTVELFFRFRDFTGLYPMHCHNLIHEDHAMMLQWEIDDAGDNVTNP